MQSGAGREGAGEEIDFEILPETEHWNVVERPLERLEIVFRRNLHSVAAGEIPFPVEVLFNQRRTAPGLVVDISQRYAVHDVCHQPVCTGERDLEIPERKAVLYHQRLRRQPKAVRLPLRLVFRNTRPIDDLRHSRIDLDIRFRHVPRFLYPLNMVVGKRNCRPLETVGEELLQLEQKIPGPGRCLDSVAESLFQSMEIWVDARDVEVGGSQIGELCRHLSRGRPVVRILGPNRPQFVNPHRCCERAGVCIVDHTERNELNSREGGESTDGELIARLVRNSKHLHQIARGAVAQLLDRRQVAEVDDVLVPSTQQRNTILVVVERVPPEAHERDNLGRLSRRLTIIHVAATVEEELDLLVVEDIERARTNPDRAARFAVLKISNSQRHRLFVLEDLRPRVSLTRQARWDRVEIWGA